MGKSYYVLTTRPPIGHDALWTITLPFYRYTSTDVRPQAFQSESLLIYDGTEP